MPSIPSPGDPFVNVAVDERKVAQPAFLFHDEQGPLPVIDTRDYPDYTYNPQRIMPSGDAEHDAYPANPVIAWHIWAYRDTSQSIKPPNVGATNITPVAALDQQIGRQLSPIYYPNQTTQAPTPWDDTIQVLPTEAAGDSAAAARIALAQKYAGYTIAMVQ